MPNPNTTRTPAQTARVRARIRQLAKTEITQTEIARRLDVSRQYVSFVLGGQAMRDAYNASARKSYRKAVGGATRSYACRGCGEPGHNVQTCKRVGPAE